MPVRAAWAASFFAFSVGLSSGPAVALADQGHLERVGVSIEHPQKLCLKFPGHSTRVSVSDASVDPDMILACLQATNSLLVQSRIQSDLAGLFLSPLWQDDMIASDQPMFCPSYERGALACFHGTIQGNDASRPTP